MKNPQVANYANAEMIDQLRSIVKDGSKKG